MVALDERQSYSSQYSCYGVKLKSSWWKSVLSHQGSNWALKTVILRTVNKFPGHCIGLIRVQIGMYFTWHSKETSGAYIWIAVDLGRSSESFSSHAIVSKVRGQISHLDLSIFHDFSHPG